VRLGEPWVNRAWFASPRTGATEDRASSKGSLFDFCRILALHLAISFTSLYALRCFGPGGDTSFQTGGIAPLNDRLIAATTARQGGMGGFA
jgi:hypothetical protein